MNARVLFARLAVPAAAIAVAAVLSRSWPKDQTVHYVLGDGASRVEELDARWASGKDDADGTSPASPGRGQDQDGTSPASPGRGQDKDDTWLREVAYRYEPGKAPRVVTHEPRLANGEYTVEIEIVAANEGGSPPGVSTTRVRRHVVLGGGVTSIELARSVPR
jgi:hypothetical protein